jgi:rRNA maturation endonuclease Nob1
MTDDWLDFYLDNILKASGSALKHYSMQKTKDDMRQALRQAIAEFESQERNFCPRCGKRTNDIHTCTPPQDNT